MTSVFDPDNFMSTQVTEASSTTYEPIPEGEYNAVIKEVKPRSTESGKVILDVTWSIDDQAVKDKTGLADPTTRQSIFLDLTPSGGLDASRGKNIQLGRLREALGQNENGKPWSPAQLLGNVARVTLKHRMYEGNIYADVKGVAKL